MKEEDIQASAKTRWVILFITWLGIVSMFGAAFMTSGMAHMIIPAINLSEASFAMLITGVILALGVFGLVGGILADRFGSKPIIGLGYFVAGVGGLLRATAHSFEMMFLWTLLLGAGVGFAMVNTPKVLSYWFPKNQVAMALGISATSLGIGSSIGAATGALFPNFQTGYVISGILILSICVLWVLVGKSDTGGTGAKQAQSISEPFKVVAKSKNIWWLAASFFFLGGGFIGLQAMLPHSLVQACEVTPKTAGLAASMLTLGSIIGSLFAGKFAMRTGLLKPNIWAGLIIAAACLWIGWATAMRPGTWILLFCTGFFATGLYVPTLQTIILSLPEIGHVYMGAGLGLASGVYAIGSFFLPSYVILPLAGGNFNHVYIYFGVFFVLAAILALPVTEVGHKVKAKTVS